MKALQAKFEYEQEEIQRAIGNAETRVILIEREKTDLASARKADVRPSPGKRARKQGRQMKKSINDFPDEEQPLEKWNLRLYVAGQTPKSIKAFDNLKKLCEEHLPGRYTIEVVDLTVNPQLAKGDQILALPTLVRKLPPPIRKIIGDLSNTERVLVGLDLRPGD